MKAEPKLNSSKLISLKNLIYLGIAILMILLPLLLDEYYLNLIIITLFTAYLAQCWNIMSGYSGQFSFGHAAFFGVGAYTSSMLFVELQLSPWIGMLLGGVLAMLVGIFIGFLGFRYRVKGNYFALATLAFAEIFRVLATNWKFIKGSLGILIPLGKNPLNFQFSGQNPFYYIILIMVVLVTFLIYRLSKSKLGLYLVALREDEDAAGALGVPAFKYKVAAIAISSFLTALAGTFYVQYFSYIDPGLAFGSEISIKAIIPAIIGGVGTIWGPVVGALLLTPLSEITRIFLGDYSGINLAVYGIILILVIIYLPEGIIGLVRKVRSNIQERGKLDANSNSQKSHKKV